MKWLNSSLFRSSRSDSWLDTHIACLALGKRSPPTSLTKIRQSAPGRVRASSIFSLVSNTITNCGRKRGRESWPTPLRPASARAKLVFFDNVYMYGRVNGAKAEETPLNPCSKKGEVRAKIATALIDEWKAGALTAMIARAADFYGPETPNGPPNVLVFGPFAKNQKASWLANDSVPHSYTYTQDAARSLVALTKTESGWNQTWHITTTPNPPTGKEFIAMAAKEFGVAPRYRVLSRPMVRLMGWFNPLVGEVYEMLYQNDSPYLFDS